MSKIIKKIFGHPIKPNKLEIENGRMFFFEEIPKLNKKRSMFSIDIPPSSMRLAKGASPTKRTIK